MLRLVEITKLANYVHPYSKILNDGNLLDITNKHVGRIFKDISIVFFFFLTNASLLSNYLKNVEFGYRLVFVPKICKIMKLKAKVVNILKTLTSNLYRMCMRRIVRGIHHVNLTCGLGRRRFQLSKVMLKGFYKVRSGFCHRSNSTAESAAVSSNCLN